MAELAGWDLAGCVQWRSDTASEELGYVGSVADVRSEGVKSFSKTSGNIHITYIVDGK